ncbi:MAG: DUF1015 domain-containing protein, partial [Acidimicrobiales bacterium]
MPRLEPFIGLRYDPSSVSLDDVIAPPYDVVDERSREALAARSSYNAIRVELPEPRGSLDRYEAAAASFESWERDGVLRRDTEPTLYAYRMRYPDRQGRERHTTGVLGALALAPSGEGGVLPHERTMAKPRGDRLDLLRATAVNTSPVWGLSLAAGLSELCEPGGPPLLSATDGDGIGHELWRVPAERVPAIAARVEQAPIVLADGHHRWETALAYAQDRRSVRGAGPWDLALALVVELVEDQLDVGPIHRLVRTPLTASELREALARHLRLEPLRRPPPGSLSDAAVSGGAPVLVDGQGSWWLRSPAAGPGGPPPAIGEDVDAARLAAVLEALDLE